MIISDTAQQSIMANQAVATNVRRLVAEYLGVTAGRVSDESKFLSDLGADWLDRLELAIAIEEHFDIYIEDDELENLIAVGDLIRLIEVHSTGRMAMNP
jgi:acyl carrier protein